MIPSGVRRVVCDSCARLSGVVDCPSEEEGSRACLCALECMASGPELLMEHGFAYDRNTTDRVRVVHVI